MFRVFFFTLDWFTDLCTRLLIHERVSDAEEKVIRIAKSVQQSVMWPEAKMRFESKRKTAKKNKQTNE